MYLLRLLIGIWNRKNNESKGAGSLRSKILRSIIIFDKKVPGAMRLNLKLAIRTDKS